MSALITTARRLQLEGRIPIVAVLDTGADATKLGKNFCQPYGKMSTGVFMFRLHFQMS